MQVYILALIYFLNFTVGKSGDPARFLIFSEYYRYLLKLEYRESIKAHIKLKIHRISDTHEYVLVTLIGHPAQ
jgi:hypothetical protein